MTIGRILGSTVNRLPACIQDLSPGGGSEEPGAFYAASGSHSGGSGDANTG
jgi:hypothetical protein